MQVSATTTSVNNGVAFDVQGNGEILKTAWTDRTDGLLVLDLNRDGVINDGRELFGNGTRLSGGDKAKDGFEALRSQLPPPATAGNSRRACVLIDPSYEVKTDYARVVQSVDAAVRRFPTGTYLIWYPIIGRAEAHDLPRKLRLIAQRAQRPWLHATLSVGRADPHARGLNASGMVVINPPYTLASQLKAVAAQKSGFFDAEITPVVIPQKKGDPIVFATDEYLNRKTNAQALAGLRPAFDKAGTVTAGNASGINDGAAASSAVVGVGVISSDDHCTVISDDSQAGHCDGLALYRWMVVSVSRVLAALVSCRRKTSYWYVSSNSWRILPVKNCLTHGVAPLNRMHSNCKSVRTCTEIMYPASKR